MANSRSPSAIADSITIENMVGSTGIDQELDLESVADDLVGADYTPNEFPGLVYRSDNPRGTALIFRSGKIVITGATSRADIVGVLETVIGELSDLGITVPTEPDITIQNIVSSADLGERLNLNAIAIGLGLEAVEYEPEQFPGLVYLLDDPKVVVLLFGSGKLVITGAKRPADTETAVAKVATTLDELGLVG